VPLYRQVASTLEREIEATPPRAALPTELELARRFGVSRVTVRLALSLLERAGLVTRQRGRGTTVSPAKAVRRLLPLRTMEEDFQEQGIKLETQVLGYQRRVRPPAGVRQRLRLGRAETVGLLTLARLVEGRVICDDRRYLAPFVKDRFDPALVQSRPLASILRELAGVPVTRIDWQTEITRATPEEAAVLGITPGLLVVANTSTEYLADGRPVGVYAMTYRVDRVKFEFSVSGEPSAYDARPR
jgi:GntR family transcriptional regulator